MARPRNYSFVRKNPGELDQVERNENVYLIPARIGSCFWAILRVGYENADIPMDYETLSNAVASLMQQRDPVRWQGFVRKPNARPWQERVIMSARMLVRGTGNNPYGLRVRERGHSFEECRDDERRPFFILRTTQ